VQLGGGAEPHVVVTGPAYLRKGQWALEIVEAFEGKAAEARAERRVRQLLKVGYGPRHSAAVK
jgi:hypothetical protein